PVSILTNILVSYLSGAAVILGFISLLLASWAAILAPLVLYPAGFLIELILLIVRWVQILPGAFIWVAAPPVWSIILYFTALLTGLAALRNQQYRKYLIPSLGTIAVFFVILLIPAGFYHRGYLELDFIDVGQGDAILLKTPQGKFMLIDGGGNSLYDVGKTTLLPYLHRRGIRELCILLNSHPDEDHLLGLMAVAEELPVKYIALPASLANCPEYEPLQRIAGQDRVSTLHLRAGQKLELEKGLDISILHPGGQNFNKNNNNNQSVVLKVSYKEFSAWLTGDIEEEAMQGLLDAGVITAATLVKVPHHGSKNSLLVEFYRQVQPRYAIISVGSNNLYGHPHPAILTMLNEQNSKILRTDQDEAVIVRSNGHTVTINTTL
ncbi:MAG TPA: ComEC/Rec2 family competence protein, partial [Syntrophomonadaceae bacterium]|nr:ComEC/Rec2 family competence protein [Syntrophomonadaceae bacterium]